MQGNKDISFIRAAVVVLCVLAAGAGLAQNDTLPAAPDTAAVLPPPADTAAAAPSVRKIPRAPVEADFVLPHVDLKSSGIASGVLRVLNNSGRDLRFRVYVNHPSLWRSLVDGERIYELAAGDSLFIPVRVVPPALVRGNTKYIINIHLTSVEGEPLAHAHFFASAKKETRWELSVSPRERIYFRNNENEAAFSLNLFNSGNEDQDIVMTFHPVGSNMVLTDTSDRIIRRRHFDFRLTPGYDTTVHFKAGYFEGKRNFRKVDLEGHVPSSPSDERRFTLYVKSQEPRHSSRGGFAANKKVDFIRLGNEKKVNPYGSAVLPLSVEANVNNILGNQPVLNLYGRGTTYLNNGAALVYYSQLNYTSYSFSRDVLERGTYLLGYIHKKGDVQIGNVNGSSAVGVPLQGKGIRGHYLISDRHKVGAFFIRGPGFFTVPGVTSLGVDHRFTFAGRYQLYSQYGRMINSKAKVNTDFLGVNSSVPMPGTHRLGVGLTGTRRHSFADPANPATAYGGSVNLSYGNVFLDNRLRTNESIYYSVNDANDISRRRFRVLNRTSYALDSATWTAILQNNYDRYNTIIQTQYNTTAYNQLFFARRRPGGRVMPGVYYNMTNVFDFRMHARGLSFDYNYFDFGRNLRFGTALKGGYNNLRDNPEVRDYFVFQAFSVIQYRNLSMNARYNYGPQTLTADVLMILNRSRYPQVFFLSAQHQYLFRGEHFVLQTSANYSHYNQLYSHAFGLFPELYYFTRNHWRFKVNMGYTFTSSNTRRAALYGQNPFPRGEDDDKPQVSQGFNVGVGIKKDFGIPIPRRLSGKSFSDVAITAFLDINGNRIRDRNEPGLENVVVRLGYHEVITDERGGAKLLNLEDNLYPMLVFSLGDEEGWFPMADDSVAVFNRRELLIPFVRGVKLHGEVLVSMDRLSADRNAPLDLSRIRITATDSAGRAYRTLTGPDGSFTFYVPYGSYMLSMDEAVLGERFYLARNNFEMKLEEGIESIYNSFYIIEKARRVIKKKFAGNGNGSALPSGGADTTGSRSGTGTIDLPGIRTTDAGIASRMKKRYEFSMNRKGMYSDANPIPIDQPMPAGLVYRVQLGFYTGLIPQEQLDGLYPVSIETFTNAYRYIVGTFQGYEDAEYVRELLREAGFREAFVVSYYDGRKISMSKARSLEK